MSQNLTNTVNRINESLNATISQINQLSDAIQNNGQQLMEGLASTEENLRLIIQVIKKQRTNTQTDFEKMKSEIFREIEKLWTEKFLEKLTEDELEAVKKLKSINADVSENVYLIQLLSIIQSIRQITSKAMAIKMKKEGEYEF